LVIEGIYETLIIAVIAIGIHYTEEYMKVNPEYSCPVYCGTEHGHLYKGIDTSAVKLSNVGLFEVIKKGIFNVDTLSTISMDYD